MTVRLCGCGITDVGASALAAALAKNTALVAIQFALISYSFTYKYSLQRNLITARGVLAFVECLATNRSLLTVTYAAMMGRC